MRTHLLVVLLCAPLFAAAQPVPDTLWTRALAGPGNSEAIAICAAPTGGVYVAGMRDGRLFAAELSRFGDIVWDSTYDIRGTLNRRGLRFTANGQLAIGVLGNDSVRAVLLYATGAINRIAACDENFKSWWYYLHGGWIQVMTEYRWIIPLFGNGYLHRKVNHEMFDNSHIYMWDSLCGYQGGFGRTVPREWNYRSPDIPDVRDSVWASFFDLGSGQVGVITPQLRQTYAAPVLTDNSLCAAALGLQASNSSFQGYVVYRRDSATLVAGRLLSNAHVLWYRDIPAQTANTGAVAVAPLTGDHCAVAWSDGQDLRLAELTADGALRLLTRIEIPGTEESINQLLSLPGNGLVLAGSQRTPGGDRRAFIARIGSLGTPTVVIDNLQAAACDSGTRLSFRTHWEHRVANFELWRDFFPFDSFAFAGQLTATGGWGTTTQYAFTDRCAGGRMQYFITVVDSAGGRTERRELLTAAERTVTDISTFTAEERQGIALTIVSDFEFRLRQFIVRRSRDGSPVVDSTLYIPARGCSFAPHTYRLTDVNVAQGRTYRYQLVTVDSAGVVTEWPELDAVITVMQNPPPPPVILAYALTAYPNPFNPVTNLEFTISRRETVRLEVYDLNGRFVQTVVNRQYEPGIWTEPFDGGQLSSGLYFARMTTPGFTATHKLLLLQ